MKSGGNYNLPISGNLVTVRLHYTRQEKKKEKKTNETGNLLRTAHIITKDSFTTDAHFRAELKFDILPPSIEENDPSKVSPSYVTKSGTSSSKKTV